MRTTRAAHNFGKVICQFDVGFNTGIPIKTELKDDEKGQEIIDDFNSHNDTEGLNSDIWLDIDKYGRAYDLQFRSEEDENEVVLSNVFETFVIYDTTVRKRPIAAVRYVKANFNKDYEQTEIIVTVYTADKVITFDKTKMFQLKLTNPQEEKHKYGEVPITEYSSDRFRQGIYEDVLSLFDLYDSAQSDTANYMTDLNDATLVVNGDMELSGLTAEDVIKMKMANLLLLQSGETDDGKQTNLSAGYIYKQYDVAGTEAYKKRLESNIHKISNIPDLSDINFSGNQSGESMKYKLFGFDQMTATKQRLFKKSLKRRYRLLFNVSVSVKRAKRLI